MSRHNISGLFAQNPKKTDLEAFLEKQSDLAFQGLITESAARVRKATAIVEQEHNKHQVASAKYVLAHSFLGGWGGLKTDRQLAYQYFEEAAEVGHGGACYKMASTYLQGDSMHERNVDLSQHFINRGIELSKASDFDTENYKQEEYASRLEGLRSVVEFMSLRPSSH